ncbi:MAG TPA: polyprenyl synthetase family protein [Candidatus Paceibacterota bacterium]|nr:polyprenyl synthetase family protein [Candidatus Paceibacterota bacterium]
MLNKIKNTLETKLVGYLDDLDKKYSLKEISPILFKHIREFALRKGKRVRPTLFIIGYLGFAKKPIAGLYTSALSLELLHDFMLVHDDIIDKSDLRRDKPTMHILLGRYLKGSKNIKTSGQDLAIIIGDVMYAMALESFLAIKESPSHKEKALRKLFQVAMYTGSGEFIEILYGARDISKISQENIYKVYDLKTAYYTFGFPLTMGAVLAGAKEPEIRKLFKYGVYLGRAFQIKDDILGMFSEEKEIGKSILCDLQEAKKTLLVWRAYRKATPRQKSAIKVILNKKKITKQDLLKMRRIVKETGSLDYAKKEVLALIKRAQAALESSQISPKYKNLLNKYCQEILDL